MKAFFLLFTMVIVFSNCTMPNERKETGIDEKEIQKIPLSKSKQLIMDAIQTHGNGKYETAAYEFVFRNKKYRFKNENKKFTYTVNFEKDGDQYFDKMDNTGFTRKVNDNVVELTEKEVGRFSGALNSVIYFATLPHKLNDKAVNSSYLGQTTIKGKNYEMVEVTFDEENGGEDHDDTFLYWINLEKKTVDFLAYNYKVNKGGVRFRSAYNPRRVEGILFQDYVNYKAEVGTPLKELSGLWEKDSLEKLSVIETEEVVRVD